MGAGIDAAAANLGVMRQSKTAPGADSRRPPEPIRPLPARRTGITLLAVKVRRSRYRRRDLSGG
jgi:hypothetical protein